MLLLALICGCSNSTAVDSAAPLRSSLAKIDRDIRQARNAQLAKTWRAWLSIGIDRAQRFARDVEEAHRLTPPAFVSYEPSEQYPWLPMSEQRRLRRLWPAQEPIPDGLLFYRPTRQAQNLVVLNGSPHNSWQSTADGANDAFPWGAPGGLHRATGWQSYPGVALSGKISGWRQDVDNGGTQLIPKHYWSYPVGTVFVDMLVKDGKVFELRCRTKHADVWDSERLYTAKANRPRGYFSVSGQCINCHSHAGELQGYSSNAVRGGDGCFSFNPYLASMPERP